MCAPVCAGVDTCIWCAQSLQRSRLGIFLPRQPPAVCLILPASPVWVDPLGCLPSASWALSPEDLRAGAQKWEAGGRTKALYAADGGRGEGGGCSQDHQFWGCRASWGPPVCTMMPSSWSGGWALWWTECGAARPLCAGWGPAWAPLPSGAAGEVEARFCPCAAGVCCPGLLHLQQEPRGQEGARAPRPRAPGQPSWGPHLPVALGSRSYRCPIQG